MLFEHVHTTKEVEKRRGLLVYATCCAPILGGAAGVWVNKQPEVVVVTAQRDDKSR